MKSYDIKGCYKWDFSHLNLAPFLFVLITCEPMRNIETSISANHNLLLFEKRRQIQMGKVPLIASLNFIGFYSFNQFKKSSTKSSHPKCLFMRLIFLTQNEDTLKPLWIHAAAIQFQDQVSSNAESRSTNHNEKSSTKEGARIQGGDPCIFRQCRALLLIFFPWKMSIF